MITLKEAEALAKAWYPSNQCRVGDEPAWMSMVKHWQKAGLVENKSCVDCHYYNSEACDCCDHENLWKPIEKPKKEEAKSVPSCLTCYKCGIEIKDYHFMEVDVVVKRNHEGTNQYKLCQNCCDELRWFINNKPKKEEAIKELQDEVNEQKRIASIYLNELNETEKDMNINADIVKEKDKEIKRLKEVMECPREKCEHYTNHKFSKCYNCTRANIDQFKPKEGGKGK